MAIELVHLCDVVVQLRAPLILGGTPAGSRMVFEVESAEATGERISAKLKGVAAADWLTAHPDGTGTLDIRATIETDDGALVYMHYLGKTDLSRFPEPAPIYVAPMFETGDERYAWLNKIQAVGKGLLDGLTLNYEWYEIR